MKKILLILSILLLSGCYNYTELNEIAITTGIAIDKDNDNYKVTILVSNASASSSSNKEAESKITTTSGTGPTISESLQNIQLKLPKILYLKHIGVMVISESIAKEGINEILDFLVRNPTSPNKFNMIIAKNSNASDVLKIISPLESFPSQNISLMLKNTSLKQGSTLEVSYIDFIKKYLDEGIDEILPTIEIIGDINIGKKEENIKTSDPSTYVKLNTISILKDGKLIGYTNERQSVGINIINNKIKEMTPYIKCDNNGYIVVDIDDLQTRKDIDKNLNVTININAKGYIKESSCNIDLNDEKNIKKIEEEFKKDISKIIDESIDLSKYMNADVFGFGNIYYKKYFNNWKKVKNDYLKKINYKIIINLDLKTKGSANKTIEEMYNKNE